MAGKTREFKGKSLLALPSDYTVVDIETNGLTAGVCEILEISAIRYRDDRKAVVFSSLIKPAQRIIPFITELTGITDGMVRDAPDIEVVLDGFKEFVGDDIIIGHNVNFDVDFLYDNLMRYKAYALTNSFVDTLRLSRKALPDLPNHKLATLAEHYGVSTVGAHRALKDCEICNACYVELKRALSDLYGAADTLVV